jgi:DNA repair exonuclease SbcCD nuclease subunit
LLRVLHLADLHLDRAFAGQAYAGVPSSRRRRLLREALEWAVDLALERRPDLLTLGGDQLELEHVTADTVAFLSRQLERAACPVLLISGNHDPATAASPYRTARWPANVRLSVTPTLVPLELEGGVVWSFGYTGRTMEEETLAAFPPLPPGGGARLLLAHGNDLSTVPAEWGCVGLTPEQVRRLGFDHALMGHIHTGSVGETVSFPGAPVPLGAAESFGLHGALWLEAEGRRVAVDPIACPLAAHEEVEVQVDGIGDSGALEAALLGALGTERQAPAGAAVGPLFAPGAGAESEGGAAVRLVTCRLTGRRAASLAVAAEALAAVAASPSLGVRVVDETTPEFDLDELAREPNARGKALSRLLASGDARSRRAATLLAEAFEGPLVSP